MESPLPSVLAELLDDELVRDPTTRQGFTNHLPMALVAKERLGADERELRRFAAAYSRRLRRLGDPHDELSVSTWRTAIGHHHAAPALRHYFTRRVRDDGVDATLRTHLPALIPGLGGGAFHGVIRLAYALDTKSPTQVAAGLAYFAQVATPLGELGTVSTSGERPDEIFARAARSDTWRQPPVGRLIDDHMRAVVAHEEFASLCTRVTVDAATSDELAACALHVYASNDTFTALHGVTGLSALDHLRTYVDDTERLDRYAFQALLAAYLSTGAPPLWSPDRRDEFVATSHNVPFDTRHAAAFSDDEHVAKLVDTALTQWDRTGNPLYPAVAQRTAQDSHS